MASKSRNKGNYHEKKVKAWLEEQGVETKKVPLSGSLGGEFTGDLHIKVGGRRLVVEVKYRHKSNFPNVFNAFEDRDVVVFRRRDGDPKQVIMFSEEIFNEGIAPKLKEN